MLRRITVAVLVATVAVLTVAATGQKEEAGVAVAADGQNESPLLAERVAAGELPPLEERLPDVPYVIDPVEQSGNFGGTIRTIRPSPDRDADTGIPFTCTPLEWPVEEISPRLFQGNAFQSCEVSADGKTFTLRLRPGHKWSDGEPVTSEDLRFTYEDVLMNEKITPVTPEQFRVNGQAFDFEVIDEYTVRLTASEPFGGFPYFLSEFLNDYSGMLKPKHYLEQFHADYTSLEDLEPLIAEENLTEGEWWTLFTTMDRQGWDKTTAGAEGFPSLAPYVLVESTMSTWRFERNPYYYKVDTEGKQLPYADYVESTLFQDPESGILKMISGETDFVSESPLTIKDYSIVKENEAGGGYRVELAPGDVIWVATLNLSHDDPVFSEVVNDIRFRQAWDMCINREELNDALSLGLGRETGLTPAEYDPERANELLDEMGMDQRNAEGFRLSPDGEPFSIPIDAANLWGWEGSGAELMVEYLREVGIDARAKVVEFGMWASLGQSNEIKSSVHWANMPQWFLNPVGRTEYLPDQFRSWGPAWRSWYDSEGESGKEPPEKVKRLFELRQTILRSVSEEDRRRAVEEIIDSYQENIWMIGLVYPPRPTLLNADFGNAPVGKNVEFQIYYWKYVEQYFYK